MTGLIEAAKNGDAEEVLRLITDESVNEVDREGDTPLYWAARQDHVAVVEMLLEAGADEVVALTPTKELLSQSPEQFVKYFVKSVSPQFVVEGEGFHFGRNRSGTLADLQEMGPSYAFSTIRVPPVEIALRDRSIHRASSSLVRKLIKLGRVEDATIVLGRPVTIMGTVVEGDQRGRLMHFPTANIGKIETLLPAEGIYAGRGVLEDGTVFPAAISIGTKEFMLGTSKSLA